MKAKNLPATYITIWMFFKLPILILLGLSLFPFIERKIFSNKQHVIKIGSIIFSILTIIFFLILFNVNLYDELRQILFLIPLIFIVALSFIYFFSKKISVSVISIFIFFFLIENIKIYPYQYVWFNTPSRVLNLSKNFELDYWGLSGRELAKNISSINEQFAQKPCVLASPTWTIKPFLDEKLYSCFGIYQDIESQYVVEM